MRRNVRLGTLILKTILLEREESGIINKNSLEKMNRNITMEVQCILNYQASGLKQSKEHSPTQISFQHCAGTANEMIHNTTPGTSAATLRANKSTLCIKD